VPFAGEFKPLWVAVGIVGGYLSALVGLTYYARRRIGVARWRKLHRLTIVGYAMSLVHTIGAGTDFQPGSWPMLALVAPVGPIAVLFGQRLLGSRKPQPRPETPPAHRVPAPWHPETRQPEPQRT
jgi:sulfoxide reductase heme-binding subunit YedZ